MEALSTHSPSISSASGIKKVFGKNKGRKDSTEDTPQSRSSFESAERSPDKFLNQQTSNDSSSRTSAGSKVAKLIPGRSKRKSRRKRADAELSPGADEEDRGRSQESNNTPFGLQVPSSANHSTTSLNNDGGSSLLTDDSEPERYALPFSL